MRIAVLGVGLIGGSIGLAARERAGAEGGGWGPRRKTLETALELGAVDRTAASVEEAVAEAQAVFACAPVELLTELVTRALAAAPSDCVVTDAGSTKRDLVEAVDDERFIGGHPVAGAETAGGAHARADPFGGAARDLPPRPPTPGIPLPRPPPPIVRFRARPRAVDAPTH